MILFIDTSENDYILLELIDSLNKKVKTKKIKSLRQQAEKLLPNIEKLLIASNLSLANLSKILVVARGASFTSLRIGVITANALAYALKIPIEAVEKDKSKIKDDVDVKFLDNLIINPRYNREPNIGIKKK